MPGENQITLIHPILVHFPIAFYFLEFFLLSLWKFKKEEAYLRFSFLIFKVAYLMMIIAMVAGYHDTGWNITSRVIRHFYMALSVFAVNTLRGVLWFRMNKKREFHSWTLLIGSLICITLVAVTADFGGDLVYHE